MNELSSPQQDGVADLANSASPQPPRVKVTEAIGRLLDDAPSARSGFPQAFSHWELACSVYSVSEPTAAQLSAVRRSVARLVADGRAERSLERAWIGDGHPTGKHVRERTYGTYEYWNPGGVLVRRPMTDADREARAAVIARWEEAQEDV